MYDVDTFIKQVHNRISNFNKSEQVRLPLCECDSVVDFGLYSAVIFESKTWESIQRVLSENADCESSSGSNLLISESKTSQKCASIAMHVVHSVQDIEELVSIAEHLRIKNKLLESKLRKILEEQIIH